LNYKKRGFSLYEIEEYLKGAGAEKINEDAVFTFEKEIEKMTDELMGFASMFANYAGRKSLIKGSDIAFAIGNINSKSIIYLPETSHKIRKVHKRKLAKHRISKVKIQIK